MIIETIKKDYSLNHFHPLIIKPTRCYKQLPGTCLYLYIDWLGLGKCVHSHSSSISWGRDNAGLTSSSPRMLQRTQWLAEVEGNLPDGMTSERSETPCSSHTLSASERKNRGEMLFLQLTPNGNNT